MSLEAKIEALTAAVTSLTEAMGKKEVTTAPTIAVAPVANVPHQEVNLTPTPSPVDVRYPQSVPVVAPVTPVAQAVPPSAIPVNPATSQPMVDVPFSKTFPFPPTDAPFSDGKGLIEYVMGAYQTMGPMRGAQIQGILTNLGYQNINDVKPNHYGDLFRAIETLKVS